MGKPFGHAETRGERIADYFMFGVEAYTFLVLVGFVVAAIFGLLKPEYSRGFVAGWIMGFVFPFVAYWVFNDFRAIRHGRIQPHSRGE